MSQIFRDITHNTKKYGLMEIMYKEIKVPILMDYKDMHIIKQFNKKWTCNSLGYVSCTHYVNNEPHEIFLHEVIMGLANKEKNLPPNNVPIVHINKLGLDNRRENLIYDVANKEVHKNIKKKARTISFPPESGINPNEIPTYVWYLKPNDSHGERFVVDIGDIRWKTTSSNKVSLRYKLEEAKAYLRNLKNTRPDLFEDYSMNGEYNIMGKKLLESFYKIIYKYGYTHIKKINVHNFTDQYLKPLNLDKHEKNLLSAQTFEINPERKRRLYTLKTNQINNTLPKYCYYHEPTTKRGDYFIITGHPAQIGGWKTTSSKKISTEDKLKNALDYLHKLNA